MTDSTNIQAPHRYIPGSIALKELPTNPEGGEKHQQFMALMEQWSNAKALLFRYMFKLSEIASASSDISAEQKKEVIEEVEATVHWFQAKEEAVWNGNDDDDEDEDVNVAIPKRIAEFEERLHRFERIAIRVFPQYTVAAIDSFKAPGRHPMPNWEWSVVESDWEETHQFDNEFEEE